MRISPSVLGRAANASAALLSTSCSLAIVGGGVNTVPLGSLPASLAMPPGWSQQPWPGTTAVELVRTRQTPSGNVHDGRIMVLTEKRLSHEEAVYRLAQISAEAPGATFLLIDGWPALQRRQVVVVPLPAVAREPGGPVQRAIVVTTAVAVGDLVIRADGSVREGEDPVAHEVETIGRSMTFAARPDARQSAADLERLRQTVARPVVNIVPVTPRGPGSLGPSTAEPGAPSALTTSVGELEIAASTDGTQVVLAGQFTATFFSTDAGRTFSPAALTVPATLGNGGDPSIAVGASGAFYLSFLGVPSGACSVSVAASPAGSGASFSFVGDAVLCPATGGPHCYPDQEHIAADPNPSTTGTDQLYVVWRHFTPTWDHNCRTGEYYPPFPSIACSSNGGATWSSPAPISAGDRARVAVGGDGSVWVVQRIGALIEVSKYNSCENGFTMQPGFPTAVVLVSDPSCPVAGLDRCDGDALSSATLAVDKTDPNHVYVIFANATSSTNDDIVVMDTADGFALYPQPFRTVTVSGASVGRRFLPWACTLGSSVQVGWYDRRAAAPGSNDLTAYFRGSASVENGALVRGAEVNVSVSNDPQCASGFRCGERNAADADTCPTAPQLDGTCNNNSNTGSGTPCDQSTRSCPAGEVCVPNGNNGGCPKYGDYNGIACAAGHVFSAWASATAPPGLPNPGGIGLFVDALPCGGPGQACCLSGPQCGTGLSCTGGTCATVTCGGVGQPCCAGTGCAAGSGCLAASCVTCPPPTRTLVDTTAHNGADCFGTTRDYDFGSATCSTGFQLGTCSATLISEGNGSTCTPTAIGGCGCRVRVTTPADCSKWATCRVVVTEKPVGAIPAGCP